MAMGSNPTFGVDEYGSVQGEVGTVVSTTTSSRTSATRTTTTTTSSSSS